MYRDNIFSRIKNTFMSLFKKEEKKTFGIYANSVGVDSSGLSSEMYNNDYSRRNEFVNKQKVVTINFEERADLLENGKIQIEDLSDEEQDEMIMFFQERIAKRRGEISEINEEIAYLRERLASANI